jgi:hypothetical protein
MRVESNGDDINVIATHQIGYVVRESTEVNTAKTSIALPPKQWITNDGCARIFKFFTKTNSQPRYAVLVKNCRFLDFICGL